MKLVVSVNLWFIDTTLNIKKQIIVSTRNEKISIKL